MPGRIIHLTAYPEEAAAWTLGVLQPKNSTGAGVNAADAEIAAAVTKVPKRAPVMWNFPQLCDNG
jgi:hypothetical protein